MYKAYQQARDLSWQILIRHKITRLPVQVSLICKGEGIGVYSYRRAEALIQGYRLEKNCINNDGFTFSRKGQRVILYDDTTTIGRQRFTVAHELGHCLLGHIQTDGTTQVNVEPSENDNELETQANIFASRLLAPACVLWGAQVQGPEDIAALCNISASAAEFRWKRLQRLQARMLNLQSKGERSCYLISPLERQVFEQFSEYLTQLKAIETQSMPEACSSK